MREEGVEGFEGYMYGGFGEGIGGVNSEFKVVWASPHVGGCQYYGPFLDPYDNTAPNPKP